MSAVYTLAWIAGVVVVVALIGEWCAPDDPDELDEYLAQLAHEAEHGPQDDPHDPQGVKW